MENSTGKISADYIAVIIAAVILIVMIYVNAKNIGNESALDRRHAVTNQK